MKPVLAKLLSALNSPALTRLNVIPWSCPVLSFGNAHTAKLATIGLNPSEKEFLDNGGNELEGSARRFHTLKSLGLKNWGQAKDHHLDSILDLYAEYFQRNPYDGWFKKLDHIISGTSNSYYFPSRMACHLDLIPFATFNKWTDLESGQKQKLLEISIDTLGELLQYSQIEIIVLNGRTVVDNFEKFGNVSFDKVYMSDWDLPRKNNENVRGYAYTGEITHVGNVALDRSITVLGYNHNIQSSFGVTRDVQSSIRKWVAKSIMSKSNETERSHSLAGCS